jgi:hypothetical protein
MIDLLKQYVDSGIFLSDYQFDKLPRSLKITYIRRSAINKISFCLSARKFVTENFNNNTFNDEIIKNIIANNSNYIEFVDNPSEPVQLAAVSNIPSTIRHIENPSEKVQLAAVKKHGHVIDYIIKKGIIPSEKVQLAAVSENGPSIKYIVRKGITPSEPVQLAAIKEGATYIEYIDEPTENVQLAAVTKNPKVFKYIKNPYPSVIKLYNELTK